MADVEFQSMDDVMTISACGLDNDEDIKDIANVVNQNAEILNKALDRIAELEKAVKQKPETVTEFADRCRECGTRYGKLLKQYEQKIKTLEQELRWIPVSEGPPKDNRTVIASTEYGVYPEARYSKANGWEWAYESGADYWETLECVTAWKPLPEPYKAESEE